ncbi:MAG: hypothetical protein Tsb0017_20000 [Geothermobacteraceae bacterium]
MLSGDFDARVLAFPQPVLLLGDGGSVLAVNEAFRRAFAVAGDPDDLVERLDWLASLLASAADHRFTFAEVVTAAGRFQVLGVQVAAPEQGAGLLIFAPAVTHPDPSAQLFNAIPDPACLIDRESLVILDANRAFLDQFADAGNPVGRYCYEITHGSDRPCSLQHCAVQQAAESGRQERAEHFHTGPDGGEQIIEAIARPVGPGTTILYCLRDVTECHQSREQIRNLANYDPLTGLPNRVLFMKRLEAAIERADADHGQVAVMFLDLDRFKGINDTLGHAVGDRLLLGISQRLVECLRRVDVIARVGGDEFVVILPELKNNDEAEAVADRCLKRLAEPFDIEGQEVYSTVSIGLACFPDDGQEGEALLKNAEFAMYQAKEGGRNTCRRFCLEHNAGAVERLVLETGLRHALENGELFLQYQPQVLAKDGRWVGMEALCRWQHPYLGLVPPMKFIPVAEQSGLIVEVGTWVLEEACRQAAAWQQLGLPPMRVGINLSGGQFRAPGLVETVAGILERTCIDPGQVELELTESMLMEQEGSVVELLVRLKSLGVHLAIDDFGTGYSSLSYLKHFPINRVKIDRSFVKDLETDADSAAIVAAIIAMAHSLGLEVIAEGVETQPQLDFLRNQGCEQIQGYLFGKPMGTDDFVQAWRRSAGADRQAVSSG